MRRSVTLKLLANPRPRKIISRHKLKWLTCYYRYKSSPGEQQETSCKQQVARPPSWHDLFNFDYFTLFAEVTDQPYLIIRLMCVSPTSSHLLEVCASIRTEAMEHSETKLRSTEFAPLSSSKLRIVACVATCSSCCCRPGSNVCDVLPTWIYG